jgi:flagellar basal-body rod protein FlgG
MDSALMIARSGLDAHHKNLEVISNNIANANTTAFKKNRAEFTDLPYDVIQQPGSAIIESANTTSGIVLGTGVKISDNKKIFTDGSQIQTDNPLDIAIKGRGFLQVQLPNGGEFAYTRSGSLKLNEQGQLSMPNGYVVQPVVTIPPGTTRINISQDGIVSILANGSSTEQQIGQLQLADFLNPDGLQPIGDNLYRSTIASGTPTLGTPSLESYGALVQGALEGSNVNIVEEMVNLIEAQRAFEVTSKAVTAADKMLETIDRAV